VKFADALLSFLDDDFDFFAALVARRCARNVCALSIERDCLSFSTRTKNTRA
jgi:hypothetical protein